MNYRWIVLLVALVVAVPQADAQKKKANSIYHKGWVDFNKNGVKDVYEDPTADIDARCLLQRNASLQPMRHVALVNATLRPDRCNTSLEQ